MTTQTCRKIFENSKRIFNGQAQKLVKNNPKGDKEQLIVLNKCMRPKIKK